MLEEGVTAPSENQDLISQFAVKIDEQMNIVLRGEAATSTKTHVKRSSFSSVVRAQRALCPLSHFLGSL